MIIEQHYDDEILIALLENSDEVARDKHVTSCRTCAGSLESLRALTSGLNDQTVWEERELPEAPRRETRNAIRGFAAAVAAEDHEAEGFVRQLLAVEPDRRRVMLQHNPEWRTAGVVRKLLAAVDDVNYTAPQQAVDLSVLATDIAESLDPTAYIGDTVMKLRAAAWRERAYALYYVGSFTESLAALDRVEESLNRCRISDFDEARAQLVRARVYGVLERLDEAVVLARTAKTVFDLYGDRKRGSIAQLVEGTFLFRAQRYAEALSIQLRVMNDDAVDETSRACAIHNAAACYRETGDIRQAKMLFANAASAYDRLGLVSMRVKAQWHLANVLASERQYEQSLTLYRQVRTAFQELGMAHELALAAIDAAEVLLVLEQPEQIADLCRQAITYFREANLEYTQGALTALAYLREAIERKTLTAADLTNVKIFLHELPKQPQLLFARSA